MKSSEKEWLANEIKSYWIIQRIFIYLYISQVKVSDKKVWNNNLDFYAAIKPFNLWNPLTYVAMIIVIPLTLMVNGFNKETFKEVKKQFYYY